MENKGTPKKSILDWLGEFYDDTKTISGIIRNLAFAGIGLIWIFRNSNTDLSKNILPEALLLPLFVIVLGLIADVLQYLWRACAIYLVYQIKLYKYTKGKLSDEQISNVTIPKIIGYVTLAFFAAKIIAIAYAYYLILVFLEYKL